jgi:acyl carrier protein
METIVQTTLTQELRQLVVNNLLFGQADGQVKDDDSFMDKGIIDSTGVLELVGLLEQQYDIKIEDEELLPRNLDSINNLSRFVETKLAALGVER